MPHNEFSHCISTVLSNAPLPSSPYKTVPRAPSKARLGLKRRALAETNVRVDVTAISMREFLALTPAEKNLGRFFGLVKSGRTRA